jgi:adenylate kinase family enzyme
MKKILVIGSGGAGKSTFARHLGAILQLEVIHLDSLYWSAGWVETPKDVWRAAVEELLTREAWVMDGNYGGTLDQRLEACDAVIFLDVPRLICLWRVLKRLIAYRKESRPDMAAGCPEKIEWEFIKYIWHYPRKNKPAILEKLAACAGSRKAIILKSQMEIESFLEQQRIAHHPSNPKPQ